MDSSHPGTPDRPPPPIAEQRGKHRQWVFVHDGRPFHRLYCTAWKNGRVRAAKRYEAEIEARVRMASADCASTISKHTFGHRLRAAGVSLEDRQDLLGHKSERITTHYSAPDIARLIDAANKVCEPRHTVLRVVATPQSRKSHTRSSRKEQGPRAS